MVKTKVKYMYPEQIKTIQKFLSKFGTIQNQIILFIRHNRLQKGVEDTQCSSKIHAMATGQTAYVFNGEPFGLRSVHCSDLECFLTHLDELSVKKYMESEKKKSQDRT